MTGQKWEYKVVRVRWDGNYSDPDGSSEWNHHITELGQSGWELDKPIGSYKDSSIATVVFRRAFVEPSEEDESTGIHF